jgi:uncharacterized protein YeaO (DUF488 family)
MTLVFAAKDEAHSHALALKQCLFARNEFHLKGNR